MERKKILSGVGFNTAPKKVFFAKTASRMFRIRNIHRWKFENGSSPIASYGKTTAIAAQKDSRKIHRKIPLKKYKLKLWASCVILLGRSGSKASKQDVNFVTSTSTCKLHEKTNTTFIRTYLGFELVRQTVTALANLLLLSLSRNHTTTFRHESDHRQRRKLLFMPRIDHVLFRHKTGFDRFSWEITVRENTVTCVPSLFTHAVSRQCNAIFPTGL